MAKSDIAWTDYTFNPWWGCVKPSDGCKFCYADVWAQRMGYELWGPLAPRRFFGEKHWADPLKWERSCVLSGERATVFCASMSDVFEELRDDHPQIREMKGARAKLWSLIEQTPHLDWLLLTKRPENVLAMVPQGWLSGMPENVSVGTSVEDMRVIERVDHLLKIPTVCRFLSIEPQINEVTLRAFPMNELHWVIVGGESGKTARPFLIEWARFLLAECSAAGVAFFLKQYGSSPYHGSFKIPLTDYKGEDMNDWAGDLRVRQWPANLAYHNARQEIK